MENSRLGDPGASLTFIFTMLSMCIWGTYAGIYTGPTGVALGVVQLACFPSYLIGAVLYFKKGDSLNGSIFLIFATLFGGVNGLLNITVGLFELLELPICTQLAVIPNLWGAVTLIPMLIAIRSQASATTFLCFTSVVIFLILMGMVDFSLLPAQETNQVIQWLCLFTAVSGLYTVINSLLRFGGCKPLPEGKPLFRQNDKGANV